MKRAATSALQLFGRLSYTRKFALITLVFLIPVVAFLPLVADQITNINRYGSREQAGAIYLRSLRDFSENALTYMNIAQKYSNGQAQLSELQDAQSITDASLEALDLTHAQYGSALNATDLWEQVQTQWLALKTSVQNRDWTTLESNQSALLDGIAGLTSLVGDTSYLILDPNLDTYYMMDTVLIKAPENQRLIFETYQIAEQGLRSGAFTAEQRALLITAIGRIDANLKTTDRNIAVAIANDSTGQMQQIISAPLENQRTELRAFRDVLGESLKASEDTEPVELGNLLTALNNDYRNLSMADSELYNAASASLELGIQNRIDTLRRRLVAMVAIAAVSILSAFLVGRSMMRSISQPLAELIGVTERLSRGDMRARVVARDQGEIGRVSTAFNQMAEELERDKATLFSRTAELDRSRNQSEKRARDLQAIAEISQITSSEQRLDVLLPLIAKRVSEKLGFEHVAFFLLDDSRQFAVLQATSGASGQVPSLRGHRIRIGHAGLISAAITQGKPQIGSVAENSASLSSVEFLPDARFELALPIRLGGELIGALHLQSIQEIALDSGDLDVLEVLASQAGITIQNARLYEQTALALQDTEEAYRRLSGRTWSSLLEQMDLRAFAYDGVSSRPLMEAPANTRSTGLDVPVVVRGQVVGQLRINPLDPDRIWTEDDLAVTRAVAERAALALEAARLLEDAQKRASREVFLSEVASKLSTSFQLDSILRDTVEELGQSLSGSTISFQLVNPVAPATSENSSGQKNGAA